MSIVVQVDGLNKTYGATVAVDKNPREEFPT